MLDVKAFKNAQFIFVPSLGKYAKNVNVEVMIGIVSVLPNSTNIRSR